MANSQRLQPYTVFTYAAFDNGNPETDGKMASMLFEHVAQSVLRVGDGSALEKKIVMTFHQRCRSGQQTHRIFDKVYSSFLTAMSPPSQFSGTQL